MDDAAEVGAVAGVREVAGAGGSGTPTGSDTLTVSATSAG